MVRKCRQVRRVYNYPGKCLQHYALRAKFNQGVVVAGMQHLSLRQRIMDHTAMWETLNPNQMQAT